MSRWTGVVSLVACAVLVAGCGGSDDGGAGDEGGATPDSAPSTESVELTLPAAESGRCMPPNVENLQAQDAAFEGTVSDLVDGTVTLQVDQTFKGPEVETVTVAAPAADLSDLILAVDFKQGDTYLVSSLDGQVSLCGLSAPKDELLAGLYDEAYSG